MTHDHLRTIKLFSALNHELKPALICRCIRTRDYKTVDYYYYLRV